MERREDRDLRKILNGGNENNVSESDTVKLFYGEESRSYQAFHDKVGWSHIKFLLFIKTRLALSEYNFSTIHVYITNSMVDGIS